MLPSNDVALKEWAVVCDALARGEQALLVRKGGILDPGDGTFQVEHHEFFIVPTYFHERVDQLVPEVHERVRALERDAPSGDVMQIEHYASVEHAWWVERLDVLQRLTGMHVYSESCIASRFAYRKPGAWVLLLRCYRLRTSHRLRYTPAQAGCISWVRLTNSLDTADAVPVLPDETFVQQRENLVRLLTAK